MTRPADLPDGSLNFAVELRCAIAKALKDTALSRAQVAARMSALLGVDVSEAMLDAYTAPSRSKWRFPLEYALAFDAACGTSTLVELLARKSGLHLLTPKEALDAELGRIERELASLRERRHVIMTNASIEDHF